MSIKELAPVSQEAVEATDWMQLRCLDAYLTVAASLKTGMTEAQIAEAIRSELEILGVRDFWYNIPIIVLIGSNRFIQMADSDYAVKSPSDSVRLEENQPFFIDMHPRHGSSRWGDLAATGIFRPHDDEQAVKFLEQMQLIQREGINNLKPSMTYADVARWFSQRFAKEGISLVDVRENFGHSMGSGPKSSFNRLFLDLKTNERTVGQIIGIEPGGIRSNSKQILVARFETCVHIPIEGKTRVLGDTTTLPIVFENR